jgi:ubiquitin C-terminal hydrolase
MSDHDLTYAGDKDGGPEYDLYAVINHTGTMAGGHYVATCRAAGALCSALEGHTHMLLKL